jgi:hypothetical protein
MFESRISRERRTIEAMIRLYCRDLHRKSSELCAECKELSEYAGRKLDECPFREEKQTCNKCIVHCYSTEMRKKIRDVMRYAGPRMLRRHPILAIRHMIDEFRGKAGA